MIAVFKKVLGITTIINKTFGDPLKMILFILALGIIINSLAHITIVRNKITHAYLRFICFWIFDQCLLLLVKMPCNVEILICLLMREWLTLSFWGKEIKWRNLWLSKLNFRVGGKMKFRVLVFKMKSWPHQSNKGHIEYLFNHVWAVYLNVSNIWSF